MSMSIRLGCELPMSSQVDGSAGGICLKCLSDGLMNFPSGIFLFLGYFPSPLGIDQIPDGDIMPFQPGFILGKSTLLRDAFATTFPGPFFGAFTLRPRSSQMYGPSQDPSPDLPPFFGAPEPTMKFESSTLGILCLLTGIFFFSVSKSSKLTVLLLALHYGLS